MLRGWWPQSDRLETPHHGALGGEERRERGPVRFRRAPSRATSNNGRGIVVGCHMPPRAVTVVGPKRSLIQKKLDGSRFAWAQEDFVECL